MLKALRSDNVQKVCDILHMIDLDQCIDTSIMNNYVGGLPGSPPVGTMSAVSRTSELYLSSSQILQARCGIKLSVQPHPATHFGCSSYRRDCALHNQEGRKLFLMECAFAETS